MSLLRTIEAKSEALVSCIEKLRLVSRTFSDTNQIGTFYFWSRLNDEGTAIRVAASKAFDQFRESCWMVVSQLPKDIHDRFRTHEEGIQLVLQQRNTNIPYGDTDTAFNAARAHILGILKVTKYQASPPSETTLLVPDTNALLFNPDLAMWKLEGVKPFELILVPAVLQELDTLKDRKTNADVSTKAERVVNFLKECRRRGGLLKPVHVRKGVSTLRAVAYDPSFDDFPSWLNPAGSDDRILVVVLDLQRRNMYQSVLLVTRDIHLINKADVLNVTCLEPPTGGRTVEA